MFSTPNSQNFGIIDINEFNLLNEIGSGSFATVLKVEEKKTGQIFAARTYRDELDSFDVQKRFFREIEVISKMNHPSIVKYFGYSTTDFYGDNHVVILTEFISNGSLEKVIERKQKKKFPEFNFTKQLINIFGIAHGMKYLHSKGVIHRDLKPSNVLEDENFYPKLCDFGFSIIKNSNEDIENSIRSIAPFFTAPEILIDNKYSNKCDVYSFAMTVYYILNSNFGDLGKKSAYIFADFIIKGNRPKFNSNIPIAYKELIEECWQSDPERRPTFGEIVDKIKNNPEFITDEVDVDEFNDYIQYVESGGKKDEKKTEEISTEKIEKVESRPLVLNAKKIDLNKLKRKEKLGSGLCADVFKVVDVETENVFAAKVMKDVILDDDKNSMKAIHLSREVSILSQISHPAIMKFFGYSGTDFLNLCRPVILTEFIKNRSLEDVLEIERSGFKISFWNDTMKLINIYGIAASMAYLHSKEIIHRDLKPGNVLVDEFLFPKLADFGFSKFLNQNSQHNDSKSKQIQSDLMGTDGFIAPEIWEENDYNKPGDVYAFAMLVYEVITNEFPFHGKNNCQIMYSVVYKKERPEFTTDVPEHYAKLIKKCWAQKPSKRPSFESIVNLLETDPNFIMETIDKNAYFNYIQFVKTSLKNIETSSIIKSLKKYSIEPIYKEVEQSRSLLLNKGFINIDKYVRQSEIYESNISSIYQVSDVSTGESFTAEISRFYNGILNEKEKEELSKEVKVISSLRHPSIQHVIGFSPINFKHHNKSVIIREYSSNKTLFDVLKNERENKAKSTFSDTKKLINIYGIASGMSYLHSKNVLHHELKTKNILEDEEMRPKITEFGFLIKPKNSNKVKSESHNQNEDIPYYISPEILQLNEPTKASDVYSFAFVVYEILINEVPFQNLKNYKQFFDDVVKKCIRPSFGKNIPIIYRNLISSCWEQDPKLRPSFESIVKELKNNKQFITKEIDQKEFHDYINFVEKSNQTI